MPTKDKTEPAAAAPPPEPEPTPEEAEAAAAELPAEPESEVRAEEFTAGIGRPVGDSAWPDEIVEELRKPLDPNRVRTRAGRGSGKFEYLAGHDVKRRASEIFGFGNWGHHVKELVEIDAVEVQSNRDGGGTGWHVGYRCTVAVWIRHSGGTYSTEGVGYGDGVEYTPAARITACELAIKEAETDALKRAFTDLGDQFGLILYAKGDEKAKITRERNAADTGGRVVRQEQAGRPTPRPANWTEALARFDKIVHGEGDGQAWLEEFVEKRYGQPTITALNSGQRQEALTKFSAVVLSLEDNDPGDFPSGLRIQIREAFAKVAEGIGLDGPPWVIGNGAEETEKDRPQRGAPPAVDEGEPGVDFPVDPEPSEEAVAEAEADREAAADRT